MIFVSDATMRPYEILQSGSNGGHHRRETGAEWLQRHTHAFPEYAWINPEPQGMWEYHQSIAIICRFMGERMYPLTLKGLEETMRLLSK